jgi:hypothetical protein
MRKIRFYLYFKSGYVTLLTYIAGHWPVVYASWHTHQDNGLLCMPIGIHNNQANGLLCIPIGIHNSQANGLLCIAIGIHNSQANGVLCIPIGIHNRPMDGMLCMPICIHSSLLAYTTGQWMGCCVCQFAYTVAYWHTQHANWNTQ